MKKKTKNLLLLVAIFIILVGGYYALDFLQEESGEEQDTITETVEITEFGTEDIAYYCYRNDDYEMGFYITEKGYEHYKDTGFPVKESMVVSQLATIGDLNALQVVEGEDKAEYGLNTPRITVAVTLEDGTERTFYVGDAALFEDADYILDVEKNVIYLADSSFAAEFNTDWSAMVQQEEKISVSGERILNVEVENAGQQILYIAYDETKEQPWQVTTSEGTFDGDSQAVTDALDIYNTYTMGTTVEYNCVDVSQYGLDDPVTTVSVCYRGDDEEKKTLIFEFGNTDTDTKECYVRINGTNYVYRMTEYYVQKLSEYDVEELKYQTEEVSEE